MDYAFITNVASLIAGSLSAGFWVAAAVAKGPPDPNFAGQADGMRWGKYLVDGRDLLLTLRVQAKWNSRAAIAAAITVTLQIVSNSFSAGCT